MFSSAKGIQTANTRLDNKSSDLNLAAAQFNAKNAIEKEFIKLKPVY